MKNRMMRCTIILAMFLGAGLQTVGAQSGIEEDPGYIEFADLDRLFGESPVIEANIHGAILRLVAEAAELEDPELADLLRQVRGVFVRVFDLDNLDLATVRAYKQEVDRSLKAGGWDTVIAVLNQNEDVNMYVKMIDDEISGMVVISINQFEDETAFLNIVGEIDPEQIGRIGRKFGINSVTDL